MYVIVKYVVIASPVYIYIYGLSTTHMTIVTDNYFLRFTQTVCVFDGLINSFVQPLATIYKHVYVYLCKHLRSNVIHIIAEQHIIVDVHTVFEEGKYEDIDFYVNSPLSFALRQSSY